MIALAASLGALPEPAIGCRIETLWECYGAIPAAADFYAGGQGAVLCRFGEGLLVSGSVPADELRAFCAMTGVGRIVGLDRDVPVFPGWTFTSHTLFSFSGEGAPLPREVNSNPDLRRVFALLCEADADFARRADYLPWLSDLTRRCGKGRARVYLLDDSATACVSAIGCGAGYVSSVAVAGARRGEGLGGALVRAAAQALRAEGLLPITAAQSAALDGFYTRQGFITAGTQTVSVRQTEES